MENKILFIGLDVDDKNYHAHAIVENESVGVDFKSKPNIHSLIKTIKEKFKDNYTFHFCYESTYSGYFLFREITKVGHECTIIAASLIPEKSGDIEQERLPFKISERVEADMPIRIAIARKEYLGFLAILALNSDLSSFLKS